MLEACWRLLARRAHSRSEMRLKLYRRGFDGADIEAALARLTAGGWLDDAQFASNRVRLSPPTRSRAQVAGDLGRRGVQRAEVNLAVAGLAAEHDLEAARTLARRWPQLRPDLIGQRLARRGFEAPVIRRVLAERRAPGEPRLTS